MRSIGKRNIKKVRELTIEGCEKDVENLREYVMDKLPSTIFDTWEMAYQQIEGIIHETSSDFAHGLIPRKTSRWDYVKGR